MKTCVLALAITAGAAIASTTNAAVLANWTFETSQPATAGPFAAEAGINGATSQGSGFHAGASTYSSPAGNGSAHSFSSNTWAVGDYYQFKTSTTGYNGISISWAQTGSNTGPRDFGLFWSTDGTTFTQIGGTLTVLANAAPDGPWSGVSVPNPSAFVFTMSGPAGLNNQANVFFRIRDLTTSSINGGVVAAGGTARVDDVIISGTAVPTPGSMALIGLAGLVAGRRRRN
ncbi:MAG: PEP-CTERM sorting domain-containing protein [Phycisphaerales bacterium]